MRERLIELIRASVGGCERRCAAHVADYLLANGVIVPPCKVGDKVYVLTSDSPTGIEESRVKRMSLQELQDGTTTRIRVPCIYDDWGGAYRTFYPNDFGKTVFLTREEAEHALKGGEG